eukprot:216876_1
MGDGYYRHPHFIGYGDAVHISLFDLGGDSITLGESSTTPTPPSMVGLSHVLADDGNGVAVLSALDSAERVHLSSPGSNSRQDEKANEEETALGVNYMDFC